MKLYAVHKGRKPGIYNSWDECKKQIDGFSGPIYKKFDNRSGAELFLKNGFNQKSLDKFSKKQSLTRKIDQKNEKILDDLLKNKENRVFIYTDGSCIRFKNGITKAGYGIYIPEKNTKVSEPLLNQKQTNNRAELTAILECIKYLKKDDLEKELVIITDSAYSMYIFDKTGENYEKNNFMKDGQQVLNKDLVIKALKMKRTFNVKLVKVRAHTSKDDIHSKNNEIVDTLAKTGAYKHKSDFEFDEDLEDKNLNTSIYTKYHEVYQKLPDDNIKINENITMNDIFEYDECTEKVASTYKSKSKKNNLNQWFIPVKKK
tara:strand:- start:2175 stop:3122 length:948 start_codon:yes stop_codon:yes gene_type:complete